MADQLQDVAKSFDAYEIISVVTPGVVVTLFLAMEWTGLRALLGDKGLSIGDLGLFVLVAFVLGHLVQALGNVAEYPVWLFRGLPTNLVRSEKQTLISSTQRKALITAVTAMEGAPIDFKKTRRREWYAITARAYSRVQAAGRSAKVDICNRNYGLSRGLFAALLVCLAWYAVAHRDRIDALVGLTVALLAAAWRMHGAGIHYARSLFLTFIDLP